MAAQACWSGPRTAAGVRVGRQQGLPVGGADARGVQLHLALSPGLRVASRPHARADSSARPAGECPAQQPHPPDPKSAQRIMIPCSFGWSAACAFAPLIFRLCGTCTMDHLPVFSMLHPVRNPLRTTAFFKSPTTRKDKWRVRIFIYSNSVS